MKLNVKTCRRGGIRLRKRDEGGFVLVLALMVMMILTLLGTLSLQIANTEIMTAANTEASLASFYVLEGVAAAGVSSLENQNVGGDDCRDSEPSQCLVKALYEVEDSDLDWLDAAYLDDTSRPVFDLTVLDSAADENDSVVPPIRGFPGKLDRQQSAGLQAAGSTAIRALGRPGAAWIPGHGRRR